MDVVARFMVQRVDLDLSALGHLKLKKGDLEKRRKSTKDVEEAARRCQRIYRI